jgi:hypothetical protein
MDFETESLLPFELQARLEHGAPLDERQSA